MAARYAFLSLGAALLVSGQGSEEGGVPGGRPFAPRSEAPVVGTHALVRVDRGPALSQWIEGIDGAAPAALPASAILSHLCSGCKVRAFASDELSPLFASIDTSETRLAALATLSMALPFFSIVESDASPAAGSAASYLDRVDVPWTPEGDATSNWGVDRVDQRMPPPDGVFYPSGSGEGVDVYVLDTGLRATHEEVRGRVLDGLNLVGDRDSSNTSDCSGHGTMVASMAAGATVGVARGATLVPVRVIGCTNEFRIEDVLRGFDFVMSHHAGRRGRRAVITFSALCFKACPDVEAAAAAARAGGLLVIGVAGNEAAPACDVSPSRHPSVLSVSASDYPDPADQLASYSNYGACVDATAPGTLVFGAAPASDRAMAFWSGTSFAGPLVAGGAAALWSLRPAVDADCVSHLLLSTATRGLLRFDLAAAKASDTVNAFLFVGPSSDAACPVPPAPRGLQPVAGASLPLPSTHARAQIDLSSSVTVVEDRSCTPHAVAQRLVWLCPPHAEDEDEGLLPLAPAPALSAVTLVVALRGRPCARGASPLAPTLAALRGLAGLASSRAAVEALQRAAQGLRAMAVLPEWALIGASVCEDVGASRVCRTLAVPAGARVNDGISVATALLVGSRAAHTAEVVRSPTVVEGNCTAPWAIMLRLLAPSASARTSASLMQSAHASTLLGGWLARYGDALGREVGVLTVSIPRRLVQAV
jgi:hypothetical protein